ncbi:MAG TPA: hypothetical protein VJZ75_05835 [Candidatus Bathyarchaeia archaeon]|nr:hypothetical protein [Candidatus Bathyarchaeia archaeon]
MMFANEGYYAYDQNGSLCYVVGNGAQYNYPSYWYGNGAWNYQNYWYGNNGAQYNYPNYWYGNGAWNYPFYGNHCGTCGVDNNRAWNYGWR